MFTLRFIFYSSSQTQVSIFVYFCFLFNTVDLKVTFPPIIFGFAISLSLSFSLSIFYLSLFHFQPFSVPSLSFSLSFSHYLSPPPPVTLSHAKETEIIISPGNVFSRSIGRLNAFPKQ